MYKRQGQIRGQPVGTGPAWAWPYPRLGDAPVDTVCAPLAVSEGRVFLACEQAAVQPGVVNNVEPDPPVTRAFLAAIATADGAAEWVLPFGSTTRPSLGGVRAPAPIPDDTRLEPQALAVLGERGVVVARRTGGVVSAIGFDSSAGGLLWQRDWNVADRASLTPRYSQNVPRGAVALEGDTAYVLVWDLQAIELETGASRWTYSLEQIDPERTDPPVRYTGSGLALRAGTAYATAFSSFHAIDVLQPQPATKWSTPIPNEDWEDTHSVALVSGHAYTSSHQLRTLVFEQETGRIAFNGVDLPGGSILGARVAAAEGVVVYASPADGSLVVLGSTPASIDLQVRPFDLYPPPGAPVEVDVSATRPGVQGNVTEYRLDWGDGTVTPWSQTTTWTHEYEAAAERTLVVTARNEAGQTASRTFDVRVGGSPPREPTLLQHAVAPENYDLTFGVLGIVLALSGGLVALHRNRRRRRRVQRELEAVEAAFAATRERPRDCEAALAERRAHVTGLGLDGRLEQAEVLAIERRIEELARALRLGTVERQLHFLPYGLVMSLREMLGDGVISVWEREHLLRAIDADRAMTRAQKAKVRALVDEWAVRDSAEPP